MGRDTEPSFKNIEGNPQDLAAVEQHVEILSNATPDDLIQYSKDHFGPTQRLAAIRACEKQIRLHQVLRHPEDEDAYLAVIPILWDPYDTAQLS